MKFAIHIACNRLKVYANGRAISQIPNGEKEAKKLHYGYVLVRNMVVYLFEAKKEAQDTFMEKQAAS